MADHRSSLRQVFGHALVFGLAPLLQKIASVVLLPLYTHHLTRQDYGEVELLTIASGLLALVLRFELRPALIRTWLAAPDSARAGLLAGAALPLAAAGLLGAAAMALGQAAWSEPLLGRTIGPWLATLLALGLFCDVAALPFSAALQAELHSGFMVRLGLAQFLLGTGVTVIGVVGLGAGPAAVVAGSSVAAALGLVASAWRCRRHFGVAAPDWQVLPGLLRFSWPLLLAALMYFVVRNGDRYLLGQLLSVADLGLYAVTWTLANLLVTMVVSPLLTSLDVWRYRLYEQPGGAAQFAEVFRVAMAVVCLGAVGIATVVVDVFVAFADPAYAQAATLAPLLASAVVLQAGYSIVASAFFVSGATRRWTGLFAIGAAIQVFASLALIPRLGVAGAAGGILAANLFLYLGSAVAGRRLWAVPYDHVRAALALLLVPAAAALRAVLAPQGALLALALDVALLAASAGVLVAIGFIIPADLLKVRHGTPKSG